MTFESTLPLGEPELMRVSGFQRYLDELARCAPEGAASTRLSSLSASLTQDLMRFEQAGRGADLLQGGANAGVGGAGHRVEEFEFTVETLPVMVAFGADLGGLQWGRVRPQETELKRITIAGPAAVIERIKSGDSTLKLSALLALDDQDWGAGIVSKGVELSPGGVGLRFAGPAPTVRVTISR